MILRAMGATEERRVTRVEHKESSVKRLLREWPLGFVFGCILFMLHPILHADFAMIDDHEIVSILGREQQVKISEIIPLIQQWAVEHNGRFRPGYYVLRILEAFFVGGNATLWYANRLLLALLSALALYWGLRVLLRPLAAGVVTLLFFSGPQNEMWTRLGPQEAYGMPLVLVGSAWIVVQLGRHDWQLASLFPGFGLLLLAGFIKESFVPVLPAALVFVYGVMPFAIPSVLPDRRELSLADIVIVFMLVASSAAQIWLTVTMLRMYKHQYAADISMTSFLASIKPMLLAYSTNTLWFVPVLAGIMTLVPRHLDAWRQAGWCRDLLKIIVLILASGLLILGPQFIVYGGNISFEGRYLTPGNLFVVFTAALGFYLLSRNGVERSHAELRGIVAGMLIVLVLLRSLGTYREANAAALSTVKFQTKLAEILQLKAQHPELPLVFYSTNVFDREPLVSVASFLAVKLPNSERPFLNTFDWEIGADSLRKIRLAKLIRDQSVLGDRFFARIADFRGSNGQCIAVNFSGFTENFRCNYSIRVDAS
jgi:hypothetical protein